MKCPAGVGVAIHIGSCTVNKKGTLSVARSDTQPPLLLTK